eukprot:3337448-Pleurochrysis_carterae.AAC.1
MYPCAGACVRIGVCSRARVPACLHLLLRPSVRPSISACAAFVQACAFVRLHRTGQSRREQPDRLRQVQVRVHSQGDCRRLMPENTIDNSMICAADAGKDACQGDSGGPLFLYPFGIVNAPYQVRLAPHLLS